MTTIPITILDNFFDNPDSISNWAKTLEYFPAPPGVIYPGKRSKNLNKINPPFYDWVCNKVLSLFFETPILDIDCDLRFHLTEENYPDTGWIHQDLSLFSFLIYLYQDNSVDTGTSFYKLSDNKHHPYSTEEVFDLTSKIPMHYNQDKLPPNFFQIKKEYESNHYTPLLNVKNYYNRFVGFSSEIFHSANTLKSPQGPRLTLLGFVNNLSSTKLPVIRSKQANMI